MGISAGVGQGRGRGGAAGRSRKELGLREQKPPCCSGRGHPVDRSLSQHPPGKGSGWPAPPGAPGILAKGLCLKSGACVCVYGGGGRPRKEQGLEVRRGRGGSPGLRLQERAQIPLRPLAGPHLAIPARRRAEGTERDSPKPTSQGKASFLGQGPLRKAPCWEAERHWGGSQGPRARTEEQRLYSTGRPQKQGHYRPGPGPHTPHPTPGSLISRTPGRRATEPGGEPGSGHGGSPGPGLPSWTAQGGDSCGGSSEHDPSPFPSPQGPCPPTS